MHDTNVKKNHLFVNYLNEICSSFQWPFCVRYRSLEKQTETSALLNCYSEISATADGMITQP